MKIVNPWILGRYMNAPVILAYQKKHQVTGFCPICNEGHQYPEFDRLLLAECPKTKKRFFMMTETELASFPGYQRRVR